MKPEKEVLWIIRLLNSVNFRNNSSFIFKGVKSKKFFSRREINSILGVSLNNKDFQEWFPLMQEEGCIMCEIDEGIGKSKYYSFNYKELMNRLKIASIYQEFAKFFKPEIA